MKNQRSAIQSGPHMTKIFLNVLLVIPISLTAQQSGKQPENAGHADEAVVIERIVSRFDFEGDGTFTARTEVRARIQSEAGVQRMGLLNFGYDNGREEIEVKALVRRADGTVIETPVGDIQDVSSEISRQ